MPGKILVITNGDAAARAIKASGIDVHVILPWQDVLHEGPVPALNDAEELRRVRARYLSEAGYGPFERILSDLEHRDAILDSSSDFGETLLWFEHDLYDQLQMIQILAAFSRIKPAPRTITCICRDTYIAEQSEEELRHCYRTRAKVSAALIAEGAYAWGCFTDSDPAGIVHMTRDGVLQELPFLKPALGRLLAEFPDEVTGLSRTEDFVVQFLHRSGPASGALLFAEASRMEQAAFMGDWSFWTVLRGLAAEPLPIIVSKDASTTLMGSTSPDLSKDVCYQLSALGEDIALKKRNAVQKRGIDRWIGGTHLVSERLWLRSDDAPFLKGPLDMT